MFSVIGITTGVVAFGIDMGVKYLSEAKFNTAFSCKKLYFFAGFLLHIYTWSQVQQSKDMQIEPASVLKDHPKTSYFNFPSFSRVEVQSHDRGPHDGIHRLFSVLLLNCSCIGSLYCKCLN